MRSFPSIWNRIFRKKMIRKFNNTFFHFSNGLRIGGVIFDMDGTLTSSSIDFAKMRSKLGIKPGQDILSFVNAITDLQEKQRAFAIIEEVELEGRKAQTLQPGLKELLHFLDEQSKSLYFIFQIFESNAFFFQIRYSKSDCDKEFGSSS